MLLGSIWESTNSLCMDYTLFYSYYKRYRCNKTKRGLAVFDKGQKKGKDVVNTKS